ncbi:sugar-binding domain-containing protein [Chitinophaga sp. CB10]|uniref:sugar-binding domain-containing protein n=1 Tax=Chitinophaga sp. CB10 TaxID=1891659 RepID=UPI0025C23EAF|nr:sugar-binding domain-containing protein [Chitinophaga sp. CB10]
MKLLILTIISCCSMARMACAQSAWKAQPIPITTRWTAVVSPENAWPEYPRPQMVRPNWQNLNGLWNYAITAKDAAPPAAYKGKILVPYPLESALSGVKKSLTPEQRLWYSRTLKKPVTETPTRYLLHFGAVDWQATVYLNGKKVGSHEGGYQAFTIDITSQFKPGENQLVVAVWDPSDQGNNPRGKQVLQPRGIMYTASSGIWQTVWLEAVPEKYITGLKIMPSENSITVTVQANDSARLTAEVTALANGAPVAAARGNAGEPLQLNIPNPRRWSPEDPYLYDLSIRLFQDDLPLDSVTSYAGIRTISIQKDETGQERIFLNGKYTYNLGVLDQGFWPDGLHTAPTDEALRFDIRAIKAMGFNTIRKHIKIEPARWYYHCDKLGMLVWQDMVTCANESPAARLIFEKENKENLALLHNHPSIVCWVLFNEGWAKFDQQRLTEWMKTTDPSRLINGHSGENYDRRAVTNPNDRWKSSDLTDIHDYPGPSIAPAMPGKARVLGEWGGVQVRVLNHQWNGSEGWGYVSVPPAQFAGKYAFMMKHLKIYEEEGLSGSIYTEPFDVEIEENGLMTYDREIIKIPLEKIRAIHSAIIPPTGPIPPDLKLRDMDTTNPDNRYGALLESYRKGKKDSAFLKDLALMAVRLNDLPNARLIADDYYKYMKPPFSRSEWIFIFNMTNSVKDKGFEFIRKYKDAANKVMGVRQADQKLMTIIYNDEISPEISSTNLNPDWSRMFTRTKQYGPAGEEIYMRAKTLYHYTNKEWDQFAPSATQYIGKYAASLSPEELNRYAITVFYRYTDTSLLMTASGWSQLSLKQGERSSLLFTRANLLYKAGRKQEAITIQERALTLAPEADRKNYEAVLAKMKRNEATW